MPFNGAAFGLPFTMNTVEGTKASLFVSAAASRAGWCRALSALGAREACEGLGEWPPEQGPPTRARPFGSGSPRVSSAA
jgi:hypothetical protein